MGARANEEITAVVVDSEDDRRRRIVEHLEATPDLTVLEATADPALAVAHGVERPPDAILIDVKLPDSAALGVCWSVSQHSPVTQVVLLAGPEDVETAYHAITYGAAGCIQRAEAVAQCVDAIRGATRGEYLVPPLVAAKILHDVDAYSQAPGTPFGRKAPLTATEREVLMSLAAGETPATIAERHEVTARLVNLHTGYAVAKLQRHAEAARAALTTPRSA
ncbi:MAG: response regulator transcription factor [Acidimicrobiales bacterium]|nr:response regulator transcription factor [Acidimicrobiales bacterium]